MCVKHRYLTILLFVVIGTSSFFMSVKTSSAGSRRYLITDTNNHRVVEVDENKNITWQCGTVAVSNDIWNHRVAGISGNKDNKLNFPLSAERQKDGNTLVAEGDNQRVIEVNPRGRVVWIFQAKEAGGEFYPVRARRLENGNTLIADWAGHRVIEVNKKKRIVWQYGIPGRPGAGTNQLNFPRDAVRIQDGNTLIADAENERVIEVETSGDIVWQFGITGIAWVGGEYLNNPVSAVRLGNGNTLVTDEENSRVVEVDRNKNIVWQYGGTKGNGVGQLNSPYSATKPTNGNVLISDHGNHRVIEVSSQGKIVWQYGDNYKPGVGPNQLLYPSDVQKASYPLNDPKVAKKLRALPPLNDDRYSLGFLWIIGGWAAFCFAVVFGLYFFVGRRRGA
jgi:uncharacterized protein (UPF0248 family)